MGCVIYFFNPLLLIISPYNLNDLMKSIVSAIIPSITTGHHTDTLPLHRKDIKARIEKRNAKSEIR